jgi:hypothetical protein
MSVGRQTGATRFASAGLGNGWANSMKPDPKVVEMLARRLARLSCYKELDLEVTTETVEIILALVRVYEDDNWPRFLEEAIRILDPL